MVRHSSSHHPLSQLLDCVAEHFIVAAAAAAAAVGVVAAAAVVAVVAERTIVSVVGEHCLLLHSHCARCDLPLVVVPPRLNSNQFHS